MIYDYLIAVKNERGKYVDILSQLLCLLSTVFFIVQQIKTGSVYYILLIIPVIIIVGLSYNIYTTVTRNRFVTYSRLLSLSGFTWIAMPFLQWLVVPFLLLAIIEKHAKSPLEIGVTADRIVFNSLIKRTFEWQSFNNVMLKDSLLTLDFKNNRLFQKEIEGESNDIIESDFNEYCKIHLLKLAPDLT